MPSPNKAPNNKSVTSPQHSATLRKIMLLDKVTEARDKQYQSRLAEYMKEQKKTHANLTPKEIEGLKEGFTRRYYRYEYDALAEFQAIQEQQNELEDRRRTGSLKGAEYEQYQKNEFNLSLGPEGFAASKMFDNDVIKQLKKQFPDIDKELKQDIRAVRENQFSDMPPQTGVRPATVELFNQRYPNLKNELNQKAKQDSVLSRSSREGAMAGLALLKWGSALANPSGYLLSKAIGGVVTSSAFKPMVKRMSNGIRMASEKTGLTGKLKKMMGSWSDVSVKRVAAGVAVGGAAGLLALGLLEPENAQEIYASIKESVLDFVSSPDQTAYAYDNNPGSELEFDNALSGDSPSPRESLPGEKMGAPTEPAEKVGAPTEPAEKVGAPTEPAEKVGAPTEPADDAPEKQKNEASPDSNPSDKEPSSKPDEAKPASDKPGSTITNGNGVTGEEVTEPSVAEQKASVEGAQSPAETPQSGPANPKVLPGGEYTVQRGDTLSELVEQRLQEAGRPYNYELIDKYVQQIAANNDIADPNLILAGQSVTFPDIPQVEKTITPEELESAKQQITGACPEKNTARTIEIAGKEVRGIPSDPASTALSQCSQATEEPAVKNDGVEREMKAQRSMKV